MASKNLTMNEMPTFFRRVTDLGNTLSLGIALFILCTIWTFLSPYFLTVQNIMNVLMFASILAIRASGLTVSMILGGMDISQNAVGAVTG